MWVEFVKDYEISEETCEIASKARRVEQFPGYFKDLPRKIRKVQKNGYLNIRHVAYKPEEVYLKTFGRKYEKK